MKSVYLLLSVIFFVSCSTTKTMSPPMTKEMYKATKKNYLKKYTKKFIKSIPKEDLNLISQDTIILVVDTMNR